MYWANFLHIYQPPTQCEEIVRKVTLECYRPLVRILKKYKSARITLNINACLTEQLIRYGFSDVIDSIGQLVHEGKVELTGSAKFHPILPLISKGEMERQIELNYKSNEHYFKGVYRPNGFFSPEMCYSRETAAVVKRMGFEWLIVDEIAYNGRLGQYKNDSLYTIESLVPLKVFFKERRVSTAISFGKCKDLSEFIELNKNILTKEVYLLTGTDGEVYGHHHSGQERLLEDVFNYHEINTVTISQLKDVFLYKKRVEPVPSSWSTWEDDIDKGVYYPQWDDPSNQIHQRQWELMRLAIESVDSLYIQYSYKPEWQKSRSLLDEGLHSCQWWWASCSPWWGPDMVRCGVNILTQVILNLEILGLEHLVIEKAIKLKEEINQLLIDWNRGGKARGLQQEYLRSHPFITSLLRFG